MSAAEREPSSGAPATQRDVSCSREHAAEQVNSLHSSLSDLRSSTLTTSTLSFNVDSYPVKKLKSNIAPQKEINDEDQIFFKDDAHVPEVTRIGYLNVCGNVAQDQQLVERRRRVVQGILANFDLEKVMDRYRGNSVTNSQSSEKIRNWLEAAMDTDSISVSDQDWNEHFRQKVLDEFERKQIERERQLEAAESQRLLKLKLQGVIKDEEEEARREELAMRKTLSEKKFDRRSTKTHHSLFKPTDIETQMEILSRDEADVKAKIRHQNGDADSPDGNHGDDDNEYYNGTDYKSLPTYKTQLGRTEPAFKEMHPQLKHFYEEEDLQQLYRGAETLVRRTTRNK